MLQLQLFQTWALGFAKVGPWVPEPLGSILELHVSLPAVDVSGCGWSHRKDSLVPQLYEGPI